MRETMRPAHSLQLVVGLAVLASAVGCSQPEVNDEPEYQSTTVQIPDIVRINPPYLRQTIAIVPFVNKTLSDYKTLGDIAPDLISEMALAGGWRVVESNRSQLDAVAEELNFGQTEYVDPGTAAKVGNMLGAKFVLIGAVTNFRITKARAKKGVDVLGLVTVGGKQSVLTYDCQVAMRFVNVQTREVIASATASVKQKYEVGGSKTRVLFVTVDSGETIEISQDSMGKVLRLAFAKAINKAHTLANLNAMALPPAPAGRPN